MTNYLNGKKEGMREGETKAIKKKKKGDQC